MPFPAQAAGSGRALPERANVRRSAADPPCSRRNIEFWPPITDGIPPFWVSGIQTQGKWNKI